MRKNILLALFSLLLLVAGCVGHDFPGDAAKSAAAGDTAVSETAKIVLGHYPEYKILANALGAKLFDLPQAAWDAMTETAQWAAIREFLDQAIDRGDEILLATPPGKARSGSYFARELEYLAGKGYVPSPDGTRLVRRAERPRR